MNAKIRCCAALALTGLASCAVRTAFAFEYDLSKPSTFVGKRHGWELTPDGKALRAEGSGGCALAYVDTKGKPFKLSLEVRTFDREGPMGHWGIRFDNAEKEHLFTWAQPNVGFIYNIKNKKGVELAAGNGGQGLKRGPDTPEHPWTKVELACASDGYVMRLGPQACYQGDRSLLGITNLFFHAYREKVEIRNIRLEPLVQKPVDSTPNPTFRAKGGAKGSWAVTNAVNAEVGGLVCWMRPTGKTDNLVFLGADGKEAARFSMYMYDWPRAQISMTGKGLAPATFTWRVPDLLRRQDEWFHFAFTWNEKAKGRFFINGLPFSPNGEKVDLSLLGNALGDVAKIAMTDENVRDLVVWRRTLSAREVLEDYRKTMPLDCVMTESLVHSGEPMPAVFRLAPGGTYLRPNPVEDIRGVKAKVTVASQIETCTPLRESKWDRNFISRYRFDPVPGGATAPKTYDVTGPVDILAAAIPLTNGLYRLTVTIEDAASCRVPESAASSGGRGSLPRQKYVRHLFFTAAPKIVASAKEPTKDDLVRGACVFRKTFGEPYLETDAKKDSRFFEVVPFPTNRLERPYLLEIDWPDDKARAMGLYMYEEGPMTCRDHLQQGLIAGAEIPSSGRIQTAKYLFYPAAPSYLFEARTLIKGRPAAVKELRVYELPEGLPRLKIHRPEGLVGRTFGHCDEDQSMDNNLTSARMGYPTAEILARLADYFGYTGQNAFHYSIMRYATMNFGWVEGAAGGGMFPRRQGELRELTRALNRNGIDFVPQNMFSNDPTIARYKDIEGRDLERKRVMADNDGLYRSMFTCGRAPMNHTNPEEVDRFFGIFMDAFQDLSTHGVGRTLMCLNNDIASPLAWRTWDFGTTNAPDWRARRCAPVTENVRKYVREITRDNPRLKVAVEVPADAERRDLRGVDLDAIAAIPNVELAIIRDPTRYWFDLFRIGTKDTSDGLVRNYGEKAVRDLRTLRRAAGGSLPVVYSYPTYFETFTTLPEGPYKKKYPNYFQNADAKPWGRHFLRELAFCLAETDMLNYAIGMQPLGSWGSDEMVREFTQAYCALPALPFKDLPGYEPGSPVVGRSCETKNGTYFYFVNTTPEPRTVKAPHWFALDLSTDSRCWSRTVELKPYELRSFLK